MIILNLLVRDDFWHKVLNQLLHTQNLSPENVVYFGDETRSRY
jgi:hypothetical protein